jgi:hypothetical protein
MAAPKSGPTRKKLWSTDQFFKAAEDAIAGVSLANLKQRHPDLSERDLRFIRRYLRMNEEEFHAAMLRAVQIGQMTLITLLLEKADQISPDRLPVAYAILQDKAALLKGSPSSITEHRNLVINGQEKRYADMEALLIDAQFDPEGDEGPGEDAADRR